MTAATLSVRPFCPVAAPAPRRFNRYLITVEFVAPGGESWAAVGGGESVAEAIASARDTLPAGPAWDVERWSDLYGD
jgi:hypothetical protein